MLKPLSQKSLDKKYSELGLSGEKVKHLQAFFLCCSNLYGVISVRDAWDIFKRYEGSNYVRKKDFVTFSGIAQREAGHPYSVYELKEIYSGEETDDPQERIIVNNRLVIGGYNRFVFVYATEDHQAGKPFCLPDKEDFYSFSEDRFYLTPEGKQMKAFVEGLKSSGIEKNFDGASCGSLLDINGKSVKGKRLADFVFYTSSERFDIDYRKNETAKQKLREEYRIPASEKIMDRILLFLMTGGALVNQSFADEVEYLVRDMDREFGVCLTQKQFEQFTDFFVNLNNRSHLWLNRGWRPDDLFRQSPREMPPKMIFGPGLKKMFAAGELDRDGIEKMLAEMGVEVLN